VQVVNESSKTVQCATDAAAGLKQRKGFTPTYYRLIYRLDDVSTQFTMFTFNAYVLSQKTPKLSCLFDYHQKFAAPVNKLFEKSRQLERKPLFLVFDVLLPPSNVMHRSFEQFPQYPCSSVK